MEQDRGTGANAAEGSTPSPGHSEPDARPAATNSESKQHGICDILDVVFILSAALFLVLVVLWLASEIAGVEMFKTLPGWMSEVFKSGKAAIAALGVSGAVQLLRTRLNRGTNPQYFGWILAVFVVIIASTMGLAKMMPAPPPPAKAATAAIPADVHFQTDYPEGTRLQFVHNPKPGTEILDEQPKSTKYPHRYLAHVLLPPETAAQYIAYFRKQDTASVVHPAGESAGFTIMCLQAASGEHSDVSDVFLDCENGECKSSKTDPGLAKACPGSSGFVPHDLFSDALGPAVYAASTDKHAVKANVPYWTVPTLQTLEQQKDRERVGYTKFDIYLRPGTELKDFQSVQYQVWVNDQPIFFNGFPPEVFRNTFDPNAPLHFSFALENLSFSGLHEGFENLRVQFTFFSGGKTLKQDVQRTYAALRDAQPVEVDTPVGHVRWAGKYVIPRNESKYEIIVNSVPKAEQAMSLKSTFDQGKLQYGDRPAVLVVRPPLRIPPYYGVVIGLVQPSGQVQFTYNRDEADKMCGWAMEERRNTRLIRSDLRIYDAGTRAYRPCR